MYIPDGFDTCKRLYCWWQAVYLCGYDLLERSIEHICDVLPFHQSIYGLIKIQRHSIRVLCPYNGGQMVEFDCVVKFRGLKVLQDK